LPEIANTALLLRAEPNAPPRRWVVGKADLQLAGAKLDDDYLFISAEAGR
jgi:hypothetical protein